MVTDPDTAKALTRKLYAWYEEEAFPIYQPEGLDLTTTVADSVLCEISVDKYKEAEGVEHGDHKRKARCAGVTADVVGKLVEILNEELL